MQTECSVAPAGHLKIIGEQTANVLKFVFLLLVLAQFTVMDARAQSGFVTTKKGTIGPPQTKVDFIVTAPNQFDVWSALSSYEIKWKQTSGTHRSKVNIILAEYPKPVEPHAIATTVPNSGAYTWTLPQVKPGRYRIVVSTPSGDGWGIGAPFRIAQPPLPPGPVDQCTAGADTATACQSCTTVAACEACGPSWVFSNGHCVQCMGSDLKIANNYPENELGVTRACVYFTWDPSNPKSYGTIPSTGRGACIEGPPWYFPDETYFLVWNISWDANSCYNMRPLRVLELFEWTGSSWVPKCICRKQVTCLDYQGYPVISGALHRFNDMYSPETKWCCMNSQGSCTWEF